MPRRIEKIREAGREELEAQHKELTEQIFRLRFQLTTGQAEALKRLREAKKDLARVKTLLRAQELRDRKSTRLNSSHMSISYAVFCLKKKKKKKNKKTQKKQQKKKSKI